MRPLGIPRRAWRISYGERYDVEGMRLAAIGSGSEYTPRALARIAQLWIDGGRFAGQQLVPAEAVRRVLRYAGHPPTRSERAGDPAAAFGMWSNCDGFWPVLPRDAVLLAGARGQMALLVPSLDFLVVRMGEKLGDSAWDGDYWRALEARIFAPVLRAFATLPPSGRSECESAAEAH